MIAVEVAKVEVEKWLSYKKINERKRIDKKDSIEALINAVCDGDLILNSDFTFTQKLKFPIDGDEQTMELKYKPRIPIKEIHSKLNGVKSDNLGGMISAYISALTGFPSATIGVLDSEDYAVGQAIAIFFI